MDFSGYVNTCCLATYVTGPYLKATPGNTDGSEEGTNWADSESYSSTFLDKASRPLAS